LKELQQHTPIVEIDTIHGLHFWLGSGSEKDKHGSGFGSGSEYHTQFESGSRELRLDSVVNCLLISPRLALGFSFCFSLFSPPSKSLSFNSNFLTHELKQEPGFDLVLNH
jgi:hypothetical protein